MTCSDACTIVVMLMRELAHTRAERDAWRLVARQAIHCSAELTRERDAARDSARALREELRRYTSTATGGRTAA